MKCIPPTRTYRVYGRSCVAPPDNHIITTAHKSLSLASLQTRTHAHTHAPRLPHTYRIREVAQMLHRLRLQALVALLARQQHAGVRRTHEAVRPGSDLAAGRNGGRGGVIIIVVAVVAVAGRCNGISATDAGRLVVSKFAALYINTQLLLH